MTPVLPALLAGAAAAVAVGVPAAGRLPALTGTGRAARHLHVPDGVLALAAAAPALVVLGPLAAALAGLGAVVVRRALAARAWARARAAERVGSAEALAVLAAELRAGRTPEQALDRAAAVACGPSRDAFAAAAASSRIGGAPEEPLRRAADVSAVPEMLRSLAACWQVCHGAGSSLAAAVDRLEEALHEEAVRRDRVEAELSGARATAKLLAALPVIGLGMAAALGAKPVHLLLQTPWGGACLVAGLLLEVAGVRWTRRIVAAAGGAP